MKNFEKIIDDVAVAVEVGMVGDEAEKQWPNLIPMNWLLVFERKDSMNHKMTIGYYISYKFK